MTFHCIPVGVFGTNCYLLRTSTPGELLVIDPGADSAEITELCRSMAPEKVRILLTHGHFDHIGAVGAVAAAFGVKRAEMLPAERMIYESPLNAMEPDYPRPDPLLPAGDIAPVSGMTVLELPGHTPGGCGFYFADDAGGHLFSGDTVFAGSVGRTDLPGGDEDALREALRTRILTLPDSTVIHPGHGPETTVGRERKQNPYLQ